VSLLNDIINAHKAPRVEMRRHIDNGIAEEQTLFFAFLFGGMNFVSLLPEMAKRAHILDTPLFGLAAQQLIASVFMMPLLMYGIAAISHFVIERFFGGQGDHIGARRALFWAGCVTLPILLLSAVVTIFFPPAKTILALATTGIFLWQWISNLRELEFGNV